MTLLHYFFDLTSVYKLGQKYKNVFVRFLVQMKTLKFALDIQTFREDGFAYVTSKSVCVWGGGWGNH